MGSKEVRPLPERFGAGVMVGAGVTSTVGKYLSVVAAWVATLPSQFKSLSLIPLRGFQIHRPRC